MGIYGTNLKIKNGFVLRKVHACHGNSRPIAFLHPGIQDLFDQIGRRRLPPWIFTRLHLRKQLVHLWPTH